MNELVKKDIEERLGSISFIESDKVGMAHDIYFIEIDGKELVVKIAGHGLNFRFEREPFVLEELESMNFPAPRPEIYSVEERSNTPSYLVMEKIEGENINSYSEGRKFKFMPIEKKKKVIESAAEKLLQLHRSNSFEAFGSFRKDLEPEFESNTWSKTFLQIMEKNELGGLKDTVFEDLYSEGRSFLENNIEVIDTGSNPVMVHQDYSFKNMIVVGTEVKVVIDWERALSGNSELDLFKFERSIQSKFRTKSKAEKYGAFLLETYTDSIELESGWEQRRNIYMLISLIETMWTFSEWSQDLPENIAEGLEKNMRKEFYNRINDGSSDLFQHMNVET